jgi:hypothetical protein
MRRFLFPAIMLIVLAAIVWLWTGGGQRVTAARIESALLANGIPQRQAACMGRDMAERLSIAQLRKLERLEAREGETAMPRTPGEFLARLRRVDDPEAIRVTVRSAALCSLGMA